MATVTTELVEVEGVYGVKVSGLDAFAMSADEAMRIAGELRRMAHYADCPFCRARAKLHDEAIEASAKATAH